MRPWSCAFLLEGPESDVAKTGLGCAVLDRLLVAEIPANLTSKVKSGIVNNFFAYMVGMSVEDLDEGWKFLK